MSRQVLLVEDEAAIADTVIYALAAEGFDTRWVQLGHEALAALRESPCDFVILDVGLPDISGFEVCKAIRRESDIPILFLTARSEEIDRVVGLEIGGDDYVAKPFSPRELVARVKAILKRVEPAPASGNPWELDEARARIRYHGQALDLTRTEYRILKTLLGQPERVYSREQLMERAWESPDSSFDRAVDTHIKTLRAKLRAVDPDRDPIQTHRGLGYSLRP